MCVRVCVGGGGGGEEGGWETEADILSSHSVESLFERNRRGYRKVHFVTFRNKITFVSSVNFFSPKIKKVDTRNKMWFK